MTLPMWTIARRGMTDLSPENTIAAFVRCLESRTAGFSFEVRPLADGSLVVMADERVDRTTNGAGNVADLTFADVRRLDAGRWFDAAYRFERVPELATVIELLNNTALTGVAQLRGIDAATGIVEAVARAAEMIKKSEKLIVTSPRVDVLTELRAATSQISLGLEVIAGEFGADVPATIARAKDAGAANLVVDAAALSEARADAVLASGLKLIACEARSMSDLESWGVSGVIS